MPSTRINRRNFFVASSTSADERVFDALLYLSRILLNECAAVTAEDSVAEDIWPRGETVVVQQQGATSRSGRSARACELPPSATVGQARVGCYHCYVKSWDTLRLITRSRSHLNTMDVPFSSSGAMSRAHYALVRKIETATPQAADQILLAEVQSIQYQLTRSTLTLVSIIYIDVACSEVRLMADAETMQRVFDSAALLRHDREPRDARRP